MFTIKSTAVTLALAGLIFFRCGSLSAQSIAYTFVAPVANESPADKAAADNSCGNIGSGTITFDAGSADLTDAIRAQLSKLADDMRAYPNCKVVITSNGSTTKNVQQASWTRTNAIIAYMADDKGIVRGRFIFVHSQPGDENQSAFSRS